MYLHLFSSISGHPTLSLSLALSLSQFAFSIQIRSTKMLVSVPAFLTKNKKKHFLFHFLLWFCLYLIFRFQFICVFYASIDHLFTLVCYICVWVVPTIIGIIKLEANNNMLRRLSTACVAYQFYIYWRASKLSTSHNYRSTFQT